MKPIFCLPALSYCRLGDKKSRHVPSQLSNKDAHVVPVLRSEVALRCHQNSAEKIPCSVVDVLMSTKRLAYLQVAVGDQDV